MLPYECGPREALAFTKRCADLCINAMGSSEASTEGKADGGGQTKAGMSRKQPLRAIDVGCAVGGVTLELTRGFHEVKKGRTRHPLFWVGPVVTRLEGVSWESLYPEVAFA